MKRLLLSCALIGATFACNAMNPMVAAEEKYAEIYAEIFKKGTALKVKKIEEALLDNVYVMSHKEQFLGHALGTQQNFLTLNDTPFMTALNENRLHVNGRNLWSANNRLGRIRFVEIAHDLCTGVKGHDKLDIEGLKGQKAQLKKFLALAPKADEKNDTSLLSSVSSVVSLKNGAICLAVLAGIVGISYWSSSKKAPQDN